jgi:hypothetical protein
MRRVLLYTLYLGLSTLILLEVLVRLWGYSRHYISDPIFRPGTPPEIPFVMKPNLANARGQSNTRFNTDALGLRSQHPGTRYGAKQPHEYRIAFMGDSFTFGQGVANEETFPQVVSNDLNAMQSQYRVTVFNFGVSGYNVKTMADTLRYRAMTLKPDLAVMCLIYADFDLNRTGVVDKYGYTVTRHSTEYLGSGPIKLWLRHLHLSYLGRDMLMKLRTLLKPARGESLASSEPIPESYRYLVDFKNIAEAHGINYLVVPLPAINPTDRQILRVEKQFEKDRIRYYDLFSLVDAIKVEDFRSSKWDAHPSALVQRRIGEQLSRYILKQFLLPREKAKIQQPAASKD